MQVDHDDDGVNVMVDADEEELDYFDDVEDVERETSSNGMDVSGEDTLESNESVRAACESSDEELLQNPNIRTLLNKMLDEKLEKEFAKRMGETSQLTILTEAPVSNTMVQKSPVVKKTQGQNSNNKLNCGKNSNVNRNVGSQIVKFPLDTTVYAPALTKQVNSPPNLNFLSGERVMMDKTSRDVMANQNIANFVEAVRQEQRENHNKQHQPSINVDEDDDEIEFQPRSRKSEGNVPGYAQVQDKTGKVILEAEKFKASVEKPTGKTNMRFMTRPSNGSENVELGMFETVGIANQFQMPNEHQQSNGNLVQLADETGIVDLQNMQNLQLSDPLLTQTKNQQVIGSGLSDDDFFHLTCHIDESLKKKIEAGEYVDLDKLLPRERFGIFDGRNEFNEDSK